MAQQNEAIAIDAIDAFLTEHQRAAYEGLSASEHLARIYTCGHSFLTRWSAKKGEAIAFSLRHGRVVSARFSDELPLPA